MRFPTRRAICHGVEGQDRLQVTSFTSAAMCDCVCSLYLKWNNEKKVLLAADDVGGEWRSTLAVSNITPSVAGKAVVAA